MTEELKKISGVPFHEMVSRHVHKLVQVTPDCLFASSTFFILSRLFHPYVGNCQVLEQTIHISSEYLDHEEKVVVANSKVEALEAEGSLLRKDLIATMDESNASKEKIKALSEELMAGKLLVTQKDEQLLVANQKVKFVAAKAIQAFQLTDEYNMVLFSWYYKGFKLLRRYLVKHGPGADLEDLNFEAIDKEMEADEAAVAIDENPVEPEKGGNDAPVA